MKWLSRLYTRYILKRYPIPHDIWNNLLQRATIFQGLSAVEKAHLRELTTLFLRRKSLVEVQGFHLTNEIAVAIAAQACLSILKLGLEYLDGWIEVTIYPDGFVVEHDSADQAGVISHEQKHLSGESWIRGPVILSWRDVQQDIDLPDAGRNVVIHEIAHKLDMLNGSANGMPPLHSDMVRLQWTEAFSSAFDDLNLQLKLEQSPSINSYAATSPAEFFAVTSEYFFCSPQILESCYPEVYLQLCLFYRQNPLVRRLN